MSTETPTERKTAAAAKQTNGKKPADRLSSGRPADPVAWVVEAERITNEADLRALDGLFSEDVVYENLSDGAFERYSGRAAAVAAWKALLTVSAQQGIRVQKTLWAADDNTIVNDWKGQVAGGRPIAGAEIWRFAPDGTVCQHRTFGSLSARPSRDMRAKLRVLLNYPMIALQLLRAQQRFGAKPE